MHYKIDLSSNGMIPNYPKAIWMDYIRIKHWKDLYMASKSGDKAFNDVLTAVLDDVINWEKTEFIKTSDKLTLPDRQKLFLWQRINCKGSELTIMFKCDDCGQYNELKIDLNTINEEKLQKKIKIENVDINGVKYKLKVPTREDTVKLNKIISDYKYTVYKKICDLLFIEEIKGIENDISNSSSNLNRLVVEKMKEFRTNEVDTLKKDFIQKKDDMTNRLTLLKDKASKNLNEINELLKKYYFRTLNNIDDIRDSDDISFDDDYTNYLVSLIMIIEDYPEENIIKFMLETIQSPILKIIEDFIKGIFHGFDKTVKSSCIVCGKTVVRYLDVTPNFFLN